MLVQIGFEVEEGKRDSFKAACSTHGKSMKEELAKYVDDYISGNSPDRHSARSDD